MAAKTAGWLTSHPFANEEELQAVGHLLWWEGTDAQGHPVLRIAIGRAVNECRGAAALALANAIVTQLQRAVEGMLGQFPQPLGQVWDPSTACACRVHVAWASTYARLLGL